MQLDRLLSRAEVGGDLFFEQSSHDEMHYLPLAWGEGGRPLAQLSDVCTLLAGCPVPRQRVLDGVQEHLVPEGLGQKLYSSRFHGLYRHGNVAMAGDEDDGDVHLRLG